MDTDKLIESLTKNTPPVRRLAAPWARTAFWFGISFPCVVLIILVVQPMGTLGTKLTNFRFLLDQTAAVLTAITAALAAFESIIPGYDRRFLLLPVAPLLVWWGSLSQACIHLLHGGSKMNLMSDLVCAPAIVLVSALPALTMILMLRKGAPLRPSVSTALGGLAALGLGNFGHRFFHHESASLMVLIWQMSTVFFLTFLSGWMGKWFLDWRPLVERVRSNLATR